MTSDPDYVARAFLNLNDWTKVYQALHPEVSDAKAREGGLRISQRRDVARALDTLRRRQVYVRKSKDDLLLHLQDIIEGEDVEAATRIRAVEAYSKLAGYQKDEKKQSLTVINMTAEELSIAERELKTLPAPTQDLKPG